MTVLVAILCIVSLKLWNDLVVATRRLDRLERAMADQSPVRATVAPQATATVRTVVDSGAQLPPVVEPPTPAETPTPLPDPVVTTVGIARAESPHVRLQSYEAEEAVHWADTPSSPSITLAQGSSSLENLFGRTLPIWAGGITLAIAGILVVKWSIDAGLLSPAVRVVLGMLFGLGLIGGAEWSRRDGVSDDRIPQALAGAGVASLYGALIAADMLYGLIGDGFSMIAMGAVSVCAGALSMRFGSPSAVLGLVGGLAAPALVGGSDANVPMLSIYVALVSGGAAAIARLQNRAWLGGLSIALATVWSIVLSFGSQPVGNATSVGLLMLFVGFTIPRIAATDARGPWIRTAGSALAVVQAAVLVGAGGHGAVQWFMMMIATAGILWTSEDNSSFRDMPAIALGVFAAMVVSWPHPTVLGLATVLSSFCLLHAIHALRHLTFCDHPRLANGLRLIVLPVVACCLIQLHVPLHDLGIMLLWVTGGLATAGAIMVVSASGLDDPAIWCQPLSVCMVVAGVGAVLPFAAMAIVTFAVVAALSFIRAWRAGMCSAALICVGCAMPIILGWASALVQHAFDPLMVRDLPSLIDIVRFVVPAAAAVAILGWRIEAIRRRAITVVGLLALVMIHVSWRRLVGISSPSEFIDLGMFDRTGWEAILIAAAALAWHFDKRGAWSLGLASLGHFALFTGLRFNPVWSEQAVGAIPLMNMVSLSHSVVLVSLRLAGRMDLAPGYARVRKIMQMVVIASLGFTLVRQVFAGSIIDGFPVSDLESIMHSVAAIILAIGFLLFGMRSSSVEWRAGSLALMLGAVSKVFLVDAAGLDGLARVASFGALGFSLIGVGWLYSRLLPDSGGDARLHPAMPARDA